MLLRRDIACVRVENKASTTHSSGTIEPVERRGGETIWAQTGALLILSNLMTVHDVAATSHVLHRHAVASRRVESAATRRRRSGL